MKLGRIWRQGPDGDVARIVAVHPEEGRVVDLATAEGARILRLHGAERGFRFGLGPLRRDLHDITAGITSRGRRCQPRCWWRHRAGRCRGRLGERIEL